MSAVVQVQCPHCRQMLRVPADWVGRTMRCKHCQNGFQARASAAPASGAAKAPAPVPPPAAAAAQPPQAKKGPPPKSKKKLILIGVIMVAAVGAIGAGLTLTMGSRPPKGGSPEEDTTKATSKVEPTKPETKYTPRPVPVSGHYFPRRALLIGINNYLFANPLNYGWPRKDDYPGSNLNSLRDQLARPPMNIPNLQIIELSDGGRAPHPPVKSVIEMAIADFVNTSRAQDRIIVLFAGHAVELEGETMLVPLEGNLTEPQTLIPLPWVYDQLAKCKAKQKVLILDICRFAPERGLEMASGGDAEGRLTGTMEDKLINPPAGVQVWLACGKDQHSVELFRGSVFLRALCAALQERLAGISDQKDPFPLEALAPKVEKNIKAVLEPLMIVQTPVLAGKAGEGGTAYNPNEPLAAQVTLKSPTQIGGKAIDLAVAKAVVDELNMIPPGRGPPLGQLAQANTVDFRFLPPTSIQSMEEYRADGYASIADLENLIKAKPGQYALRKAFLQAAQAIKASDQVKTNLRENLRAMTGGFDDDFKETLLKEQEGVTMALGKLKETLEEVKKAGDNAAQEKSKRWLANYEFALARLMTRIIYLAEYSSMIDNARSGTMPELQPFHQGWRMGASKTVNCQEADIQMLVNALPEILQRIQKEYPGTPWSILAQREGLVSMGMEWKPAREY